MIKFYVDGRQIYNFLILKEPVQLISNTIDQNYFEFSYRYKDLIIETYRTYSTVELKTFRKVVKRWWKNLWKKNS